MQLRMELGEKSYPILIEKGALGRLACCTNVNRKALIVTDTGVPAEYARKAAEQFTENGRPSGTVFTVEQGEQAKSFPVFEEICKKLLALSFTRSDVVVAVGGGVIGDLAGFAAACYMRGIGFISIPTTTLSQIDSSIGGKTALNLDGIKNCVGAFYQPELVVVDGDTLQTLPRRHFYNGLVEALKAGLLGDSGLFELFLKGNPEGEIDQIVQRSLAVKKAVVERDERESGLRKLLNLGHTVGHGLESVYGLEAGDPSRVLLHGEAVAMGMLPMLDSSVLRRQVEEILAGLSIPTAMDLDPERVYEAMTRDKKTHGDRITTVRVRTPGDAYLQDISTQELRGLLDGFSGI